MEVTKLGTGRPEVSVVACVHGDEAAGAMAIDRFRSADHEVQTPVQFVVANEAAREAGERSIDADLNRSFPGNRRSDDHEVALAPDLLKQVRDTSVLDLHATSSTREPHAFCVHYTLETMHLLRSTGVERVVDPSGIRNSDGGLTSHCRGVVVECGPQGQPEAVDAAHEVLVNFLAATGVIDAPFDYPADPQLYRVFGKIDHPAEAAELHARNFHLVREGDAFLTVDGEEVTAEQDFYPVLASVDDLGAPFVGFKAKNVGTISEELF